MAYPKAYDPEEGYQFQILTRSGTREWEHCDYAVDRADRKHLRTEYAIAYGPGFEFKTITLPKRYWPKKSATQSTVEGLISVTPSTSKG